MNQLDIVQGEDRTLTIQLKNETTGELYDLTGYTEVVVAFKKTDGTVLNKTYSASGGVTVPAATSGKVQVVLTDANTALLKKGIQPIYITVDKGSDKRIVVKGLEKALNVMEKPF